MEAEQLEAVSMVILPVQVRTTKYAKIIIIIIIIIL